MRLLVDEHLMDWDRGLADHAARRARYTNHTLLAEALEKWPLPLFGTLLPRHLEIIFEINRRFLDDVRLRHPGDDQLVRRLSLIDETGERYVRMAHLAAVGSHAINGVAALHTELLKQTVLSDFHAVAPEKFFNVTNGVTPRRWMALSNPGLSALITRHIGDGWIADLEDELARIEPLADGQRLPAGVARASRPTNKRDARRPDQGADRDGRRSGVAVRHPGEAAARIQAAAPERAVPRDAVQPAETQRRNGDDAAHRDLRRQGRPRLSHGQADHQVDQRRRRRRQSRSEASRRLLKVVFLPDFNVKNGQHVYPAADLSEQISTAGKEASGTGNMKFAMNGALTIGTLDGANVEIRDAVGHENFFLFGLTAGEVVAAQGARATGRAMSTSRIRSCARRSTRSAAGSSPTAIAISSGRSSTRCSTATTTCCSPTIRRMSTAQQRVSEAYRDRAGLDPHVDSELRESRTLLVGSFDPGLLPPHLEHSIRRTSRRSGGRQSLIGAHGASGDRPPTTAGGDRRSASRRARALRSAPPSVPEASTSACSRRAPSSIELLLFDDVEAAKAGARDPARSASTSHVSLLARLRPESPAGTDLRLPRPRTVRAGPRAPVRSARRCSSTPTAAPSPSPARYDRAAATRPGDNAASAMKSVVADPGGYDWEGDAPIRRPVRRDDHLRASRRAASPGIPAPGWRPGSEGPTPA